jgi:hypothetical protein
MGAIAWGRRLFGRVDRVPGRYHVATLCFHFCYLPLVPLGTFLILSQSMSGMSTEFTGIRLPLSLKSWLIAWSRTVLWFLFVLSCVLTTTVIFPGKDDRPPPPGQKVVIPAISASLGLLLFGPYFTPGIGRATRARAAKLAAVAAGKPRGEVVVAH